MPPHVGADGDDDMLLFAGVRFALVGFDPVSESQYRSEIVRRAGADAGGHGADCTHVVVCGLVYDDPVCVAARENGKKVVTELWVDDSLDLGVMADADRVLYRPVRDLNGIPGSESLHICLTGYQKNWREDIMKMVTLMGAHFSKPLIAHKVTHLICYKFEGEKYELAKKVKINCVNHQWLEDCLKAWEILPIDNYTKSGWEIEIMEAQAKDSEDEAEDAGRGSSHSRGIARSTPITETRMGTHVDPDVHAFLHDPTVSTGNTEVAAGRHLGTPQQINKAENISKMSLDIKADIQTTPNTNSVATSADHDPHDSIHPPINPSGSEAAPADQGCRDKAKDSDKRALYASTLFTPNTSGLTVCADRHVHQSIMKSAIPVDNIDSIDGKSLNNANQINVNNVLWSTPSEEKCPEKKTLHSLDMSGNVDQKDDRPEADHDAKVDQSNVEENQTLCEANLRSGGNTASKNTQNLIYSRRRSQKSVSLEANLKSVHQTASPQSFEGNTARIEFDISPSRKTDHKISELVDAQSLRDEVIKHVDRPGHALAQRKSRLYSTSPKLPNGGTNSATGIANSPFSSREVASEAAMVLGSNSTESTKVDGHLNSDPTVNLTEKQKPGSLKNNLLSYRTLKLVRSSEVEKLSETFANEKNMESLSKAKALAQHEAAAEKGCAISPSVSSEVGIANSSFSLQNGDTEMSDAPQVNKIEVVALNSEPDKVVSHTTLEAGPKEIPVNAVTGECGTFPQKVSTSRVRNAGAKRSRNAGNEAHAVFVDSKNVAASKSKHDKVVPHENVEAELEKICTSPSAAECRAFFPEEILSSRARNAAAKSSLDANSEMNDALAVSKTDVNVILHENMEKTPKKLSSSASANEYKRNSSEKVPNAIARDANAKVPVFANIKMADAPNVDKTETVPLKSNFSEAVPPENAEAYPKKLSNSASADDHETCTPNRVSNSRVRKAVAKRKVSAVQQHRSGSEPCKTSGVFLSEAKVVTSKRAAGSSTNAGKVTVDQNPQNANEDGTTNAGGSFCKDAMGDRSKDLQNTNSRSGKRQKTADVMDGSTNHNKENMPVDTNLTPKSKYGNNCVSSRCITKAVQNGKDVLSDRSMIEGNECGTFTLLEPTWFILSGHRLLRKEYKSILRRLKGRVCRDSHHWSFQATHFITPDLRRTEKFFAAAAAGRWILKSDYLTACNEAGKLVEEESFEWHGHGLNNGDTISLDAPRKWRQLRQRTGHGAFYGMQIIIYGECISPSLDTLKRAVRAGDGTILATSPPYTRFLKRGVNFAVVSAGMPSADAWVQEFQSHNIPCISADYLVEYVCKPGHLLDKHVLFNMHVLADKSLQKLLKNQQDLLAC